MEPLSTPEAQTLRQKDLMELELWMQDQIQRLRQQPIRAGGAPTSPDVGVVHVSPPAAGPKRPNLEELETKLMLKAAKVVR